MLEAVTTDTVCKVCAKPIVGRRSSMQTTCVRCVLSAGYAKDKALRQERRETKAAMVAARKAQKTRDRAKRESLKTLGHVANDTQEVFNRYVRLRDANDGCISCDKPANWTGGTWHASHLRSVKAAGCLRFNLWNVHKSCDQCNHFKSGNIAEYRLRVPAKIGAEHLDWLDTQNQLVKYDRAYLYRLRKVFARKGRRLEKRMTR